MKKILRPFGIFCLMIMIISFLPIFAKAQTSGVKKNKVFLGINMNWMGLDFDEGDSEDISSSLISLNFGYFINDMFEIGPEFSYSNKAYSSIRDTFSSLVLKANIHFTKNDQIIPYAGLRAGVANINLKFGIDSYYDTSFNYGGQLGFDYFLTHNISLNPELRYIRSSFNFKGMDFNINDIIFMLGFSYYH